MGGSGMSMGGTYGASNITVVTFYKWLPKVNPKERDGYLRGLYELCVQMRFRPETAVVKPSRQRMDHVLELVSIATRYSSKVAVICVRFDSVGDTFIQDTCRRLGVDATSTGALRSQTNPEDEACVHVYHGTGKPAYQFTKEDYQGASNEPRPVGQTE